MIDYVIIAIILAILGGAIFYILRARKKGVKCVGCPNGGHCNGKCDTCSGYPTK